MARQTPSAQSAEASTNHGLIKGRSVALEFTGTKMPDGDDSRSGISRCAAKTELCVTVILFEL
jgi:hypothetical protein